MTKLLSLRNRQINNMRQSQISVRVAMPALSPLTGYSALLPTPVALRHRQLVLSTVFDCVTVKDTLETLCALEALRTKSDHPCRS